MRLVLITAILLTAGWLPGHSGVQGQTIEGASSARYPTMLDMTFPEFEAAAKKTDIVLLPIGAIEEHSSHLPLGTDAMNATAQVFHVQQYLRHRRSRHDRRPAVEHWHHERGQRLGARRHVRLSGKPDHQQEHVRRSLRRRAPVAPRQRLASRLLVYRAPRHPTCRSCRRGRSRGEPQDRRPHRICDDRQRSAGAHEAGAEPHILSVEKGRNFEMVAQLLGRGMELPRTTHADGAETSWTLYFHPEVVRPGYERFPQSPSSLFLEVLSSGDRSKNPSGSGGFPFEKASADVGKQIVDYKTARIGEAILQVLRAK